MRLESDANRNPRFADLLGFACLIACLLLMSFGVRTVQADDASLMSVDPARVEAERQKMAKQASETQKAAPAALPAAPAAPREIKAPESGRPAVEIQPGVVVLNTRGFNYGPPPEAMDPAAMRVEKGANPAN